MNTGVSCQGKHRLKRQRLWNMDRLAKTREIGWFRTVPKGMSPGSDTANPSVIGYDPKKYYSGRSPLEAFEHRRAEVGTWMCLSVQPCLTWTEDEDCYEERTILDHSSGENYRQRMRQFLWKH